MEGATPTERKQFHIDERRHWQGLEENVENSSKGDLGLGKLLVSHPKELMTAKPKPRGVAGASNNHQAWTW